jgi:phenylacetate-CoA ligase
VSDHYDALETRSSAARAAALATALPAAIHLARTHTPYFSQLLAHLAKDDITDRASLAHLPVTRKSDLFALQTQSPPFGGLLAVPVGALARVFVSPGPFYDPEGSDPDYWGAARCLFAAGFRAGDIVHNSFSYHLTPAGSMFETGLRALGAAVIPGGVGQTEQQLSTIAAIRPTGYVGTPSFLRILLEKAIETGVRVSSIRRALVSGEAFLPAVRSLFTERGIDAYQVYGTADLGLIAYESVARDGLVCNESCVVEIVRPGTGDPVPDGEVGEVVVTQLHNRAYPLIRFGTGDLSAILPGDSACGRTNVRIKGWLGRADQTTKVRGMFVHPHQIAEVVKRFPEIQRARLTVTRRDLDDEMHLTVAAIEPQDGLTQAVANALRDITKLRGEVTIVAPESIPNDGKVIDDQRPKE